MSLVEAQNRCGGSHSSVAKIDEAHAQTLLTSWASLAGGASMTISQQEVQALLQYLLSRKPVESSFSTQPGQRVYWAYVENIVDLAVPSVSIKPNAIQVCGVVKLSTPPLVCPGLGDRADLYEASIVPVAGKDSSGLSIQSIRLNGEVLSSEALADFQAGLQAALTNPAGGSEGALFTRRQSITLGEGTLTINVVGPSEKERN